MHEIGSLVVQGGDVASDALGGRDTILVAGNGLALDLFYNLSDFKSWNPSTPLQWNIRNPFTENELLLEALPHAHDRVKRVLRSSPDAHDFEVFRQALDGYDVHDDLTLRTAVELRHFLAIAYSHYQRAIKPGVRDPSWRLRAYIRSIAPKLLGIISFNYDVTLETIVAGAGRQLLHLAVDEDRQRLPKLPAALPVMKPHGSINYAPVPGLFGGALAKPSLPPAIYVEQSEYPRRLLPSKEWPLARQVADLVIPSEASRYLTFRWTAPVWSFITHFGRTTKTFIFLGLSYAPVDRPELNLIMNTAGSHAQAIFINPQPSQAMLDYADRVFEHVSVCTELA